MLNADHLNELETMGKVEVDMGTYCYNYSNCIYAYIERTERGKYAILTDYKELVDSVDTVGEVNDILYDLQLGVYAEHSSWYVNEMRKKEKESYETLD